MDQISRPNYSKHARVKFDDRTPFWVKLRYKYLTLYFAKRIVWAIFRFVLLIGISYVILLPYFSKIAGSFMSREDFVDVTVKLIPKYPTLDTYKAIINDNQYFKALFNTTLLSLGCALLQTLSCAVVGYGLSKFKFRGNGLVFIAVILTMIIPHKTIQLSMTYQFKYFDIWGIYGMLAKQFGWSKDLTPAISNLIGTYWPFAILSATCLAFKNGLFVFIMRQYYKGVPDELEEAAYVDGCGVMGTFVKIILRMSIPMMVTIFLFAFSWQWSDTFYMNMFFPTDADLFLPKIVKIPVSLDTNYIAQSTYETAIRNTCGLLILIPLVIVYLFGQKSLIQGIERSGVTG